MRLLGRSVVALAICGALTAKTAAAASSACPGDANGDRIVNSLDMVEVLNLFGQKIPRPARGNERANLAAPYGFMDASDLAAVLANIGRDCNDSKQIFCPGDFNNDGVVNAVDITVNLANQGSASSLEEQRMHAWNQAIIADNWGPCSKPELSAFVGNVKSKPGKKAAADLRAAVP